MFRVSWHFHPEEEVQNRFSRGGHLGSLIRTILAMFYDSFYQVSTGLFGSGEDYQDDGHCSHFLF